MEARGRDKQSRIDRLTDLLRARGFLLIKLGLATVALILAVVRLLYYPTLSERMDLTFFLVMAAIAAILLLPWERLRSFKAGGVEVSLDAPQIKAALKTFTLSQEKSIDPAVEEKLERVLERYSESIETIRGARILWIDQWPRRLLAERRLLRALGISVRVSKLAETSALLDVDNDFDLIISSIADNYAKGLEAIKAKSRDPITPKLPTIYYTALGISRARHDLTEAGVAPTAQLAVTPVDLFSMILRTLTEVRSMAISLPGKKSVEFR